MEAIFSCAASVTVIKLHLSNHYYGLPHNHTGYLVCRYMGHKYSLHNYTLYYRKPFSFLLSDIVFYNYTATKLSPHPQLHIPGKATRNAGINLSLIKI